MIQLDFAILDWIAAHLQTPLLDQIMPFVSKLGDGPLWVALGFVLLCFPKTRKPGVLLLCALLLNYLCANVFLKQLVARPRPFVLHPDVVLLVPPPGSYSFPSGHTAASFAMASSLFCSFGKKAWPLFVLAALIGFSRLYLYVHYPSDVLGGVLVGCLAGYVTTWAAQRLAQYGTREGSD